MAATEAGVAATTTVSSTTAPTTSSTAPVATTRHVKPDQDAYKQTMESLGKEIDTVQTRVTSLREKIANVTGRTGQGGGGEVERRKALRAQLDDIRRRQSGSKGEKQAKLDQLRQINEAIKKKTAEIATLKGRLQYRSSAEVDAQIKALEAQVESGRMKLTDEKRALAEINTLKKSKKVFESFTTIQASIDADRERSEALRASLDDPESKALAAEHDKVKGELDELHKANNDAYASRQTLFDERDALSKQLGDLYLRKKETQKTYREGNDRWYTQMKEDREKRDAKRKEEMAKEDNERRQEYFAAQLEEASMPAFADEIFTCENLINYFEGGKNKAATSGAGAALTSAGNSNLPKLEARQVEAMPDDLQAIGRKSGKVEEEVLFGGGGKKNRKKGVTGASSAAADVTTPGTGPLRLDLVVMDQLRTMDVAIPLRQDEVPAVVKTLRQKVAWFKMNNDVVTEQILAGVKAQQALALEAAGKESPSVEEGTATATATSAGGRGPRTGDRRERHSNYLPKGSDAKGISSRVKRAALSTLSTNGDSLTNGADES